MATDDLDTDFRALVARHHVRFHTYSLQAVRDGELVTIGFEIELYGTHDHPSVRPEPGCTECVRVYRSLRQIAEAVTAHPRRETDRTIEPYEPSLVMVDPRGDRQDVRCRIQFVHHDDYHRAVDDCQRACVREVADRLRGLGAHETS